MHACVNVNLFCSSRTEPDELCADTTVFLTAVCARSWVHSLRDGLTAFQDIVALVIQAAGGGIASSSDPIIGMSALLGNFCLS